MDANEIITLLRVYEEANANMPALANIRDAAWKQLLKINAELAPKAAPVFTPTPLDKAVKPEPEPKEVYDHNTHQTMRRL